MKISRRSFFKTALTIGASLAWCGPAQGSRIQWHERRDLYPQGVASGDPDPHSVILWTRHPFAQGTRQLLTVEVAEDEAFRRVIAHAQALHLLALDPVAETISDPNVYGFRPERSTHDAIGQCFVTLSKRHSPQWILEGDIRLCFDKISHQWLKTKIPMDKAILGKWLKAGHIDQPVFHQTLEGTPQGGICSPILARLALNGLEHRLREIYPKGSPESRRAKVNIVVYADDFVITRQLS